MRKPFIRWVGGLLVFAGQAAVGGEILIDSAHHALGESLRAIEQIPPEATPSSPVPACIVVHGSGGLFRENAPGEPCGPAVESNFQGLIDTLDGLGVAAIAPSSFASRDARFCEDNDDSYLQFAPAPFFNAGDGPPQRNDFYKIRRVVIRTLDLLAATRHACAHPSIDCDRLCLVGTSNGGTTMMAYIADDLSRHLTEYTDTSMQREHESSSSFADRQTALANFPMLPVDLGSQLAARPRPRFVQAISPGCSLRRLVPTLSPDDPDFDPDRHLTDLYYPADPTELTLEIGTTDTVPDACYDGGIREVQARAVEALAPVEPSRYLVNTHDGAGHNLLGELPGTLHARLTSLVVRHFFPAIFADGFETVQ